MQWVLEDEKRELELTVERRVQSQIVAAQEKARLDAEEPLKLRVLEKEGQIASMQRQIEELKQECNVVLDPLDFQPRSRLEGIRRALKGSLR